MSETPVRITFEERNLTVDGVVNLVESGEQVYLGKPTEHSGSNHPIVEGDAYWEAIYCYLPTWYVMKVWVLVGVSADEG